MNANDRLARELMGYGKDTVSGYQVQDPAQWICKGEWLTWHPESNDAQAQMVVNAVAKQIGYTWSIRTWYSHGAKAMRYDVRLAEPGGDELYGRYTVADRNAHIVAAAVKALDSLKPQLHRCKGMPRNRVWKNDPGYKTWRVAVPGGGVGDASGARYCHYCGHDLNTPDEEGSDD